VTLSDISVERIDEDLTILRLEGEHDLNTAPELRTHLEQCRSSGSAIVLDLSATTFIDSSILAALVDAHRSAHENSGGFAIVIGEQPGSGVHRILEITGLDERLEVHRQLAAAIAAARDQDE
jgi:anti-sigma B factor antagonist